MDVETLTVIPSRKRPFNVARMRTFFPDAIWWVNELEADTYLEAGVPERLLWRHTIPDGIVRVFNGLMDEVERSGAESFVFADDDLQSVRVVETSRKLEPVEVRALFDNLLQLLIDLDLTAAKVSSSAIGARYGLTDLFRTTDVIHGLWVGRGPAVMRRYRKAMGGIATDLDWSLQAYMEDRVTITDCRFWFDTGVNFSNLGGNTGLVTREQERAAIIDGRKLWGGALKLPRRRVKGVVVELAEDEVKGLAMNTIQRRNPRASRL